MKIPYVLLDASGEVESLDSQWDMAMIHDMLTGEMWKPALGYEFEEIHPEHDGKNIERSGCVAIVPARQNAGHEEEINFVISNLEWCVLILCGDEERSFDLSKLSHPNMKVWLMQPRLEDEADYYIGSGYTKHLREYAALPEAERMYLGKPLDWYFAGQNNHERRSFAMSVLRKMLTRDDIKGSLLETHGFTQGAAKQVYALNVFGAKAVPCPSGIQSPDSFRLYEALEAGAVPIADSISLKVTKPGYWPKVFNGDDFPFKTLEDYENLEGYICDIVREYPRLQNQTFAWWQNYKRKMVYKLQEHVNEISSLPYIQDMLQSKITVLMVTSPIKSNPDTRVIETSIKSIRALLPDCEILIGVDGVRSEQQHYRDRYEGFKQRLLWKCNSEWTNVVPVVFEDHMHQAMMTRRLLSMVKTPTILFVEHDMVMVTPDDPEYTPYDWQAMVKTIEEGTANIIRFHFEAVFPEVHLPLMVGEHEEVNGVRMIRTVQYSQRPHLASTAFYRDVIDRYFTEDSRTFIEDAVHGKPVEAYENNGITGWNLWRIWIYAPENNMKRCYTIDGREDDPKYEMRF